MAQYILGAQGMSLKGEAGWDQSAEEGRVRSESLPWTYCLPDGERKYPTGFKQGHGCGQIGRAVWKLDAQGGGTLRLHYDLGKMGGAGDELGYHLASSGQHGHPLSQPSSVPLGTCLSPHPYMEENTVSHHVKLLFISWQKLVYYFWNVASNWNSLFWAR